MSPVSDTIVIDLGTGWDVPDEPAPPASLRRPLAGALAFLVLVLLGGSTVARSELPLMASVSMPVGPTGTTGTLMQLSRDALYVSRHGSDGGGVVTAYGLPRGAARWTVRLPDWVTGLVPVDSAGVLLVETFDDRASRLVITALNARTGRAKWSATDDVYIATLSPASGRPLLMSRAGRGALRLRSVDPRNGNPAWTLTLPTGTDVVMAPTSAPAGSGSGGGSGPASRGGPDTRPEGTWDGAGADGDVAGPATTAARRDAGPRSATRHPEGRMVAQPPDGPTRVIDLATGVLVASGEIRPVPGGPPMDHIGGRSLSVIGASFVVTVPRGNTTLLVSYALDTLAERWRSTVDTLVYQVTDCGVVLCLSGRDCGPVRCVAGPTNSLTAVDPVDGRVRWRTSRWSRAVPVGDRLLVSGGLWGRSDGVVDAATGAALLRLEEWSPVTGRGATTARTSIEVRVPVDLRSPGPEGAADTPAAGAVPGDATVLLTTGEVGGPDTWFAVLRTGPLSIHPIGSASDVVSSQCQVSAGYVACPARAGVIEVRRYRP